MCIKCVLIILILSVTFQDLYEAKNAAYQSKFGETMPNIYANDN